MLTREEAKALIEKWQEAILNGEKPLNWPVPKRDLKDGAYYYGDCRNATVARWSDKDQCFYYMRTKFGDTYSESINHPEDDDGHDLFLCVGEIEPTEKEIINEYY